MVPLSPWKTFANKHVCCLLWRRKQRESSRERMRVCHTEKVPRVPVIGMGLITWTLWLPRPAPLLARKCCYSVLFQPTLDQHTHTLCTCSFYLISGPPSWSHWLGGGGGGGGIKQETVLQDRLEEQQLSAEFCRDACTWSWAPVHPNVCI